jgi:SAM-dependent MidA family methyltransferase
MELHVGLENDRFVLVPESPDAAAAEVASQWYTWVPVGQRVPVMLGMREWLAGMPGLQGAVLIADYGGPDAWKTSRDGSVRAYAAHDHANVLAEPGSVDLTASIDTTLLHAWAEEAGWTVACHETQEAFLLRHDILSAINRADRTTKEGASAYLRMRQLLLPTGMGAAFRFLRLERDVPPDLRGPPHDA